MIDLNYIAIFSKVVDAGSFTGAARQLKMPKSAVSRKVALLEESLGVRLLQRTTRKLYLTDSGKVYFEQCKHALATVEEANETIITGQVEPSGVLRVVAPVEFATYYLHKWVQQFLTQYPKTKIELLLTDQKVDFAYQRIDLSFQAGTLKDSSLMARRLGPTRFVFCASPPYLKKAGVPKKPTDLLKHECILFGKSLENISWEFYSAKGVEKIPVKGRLSADHMGLILQAALNGLGVAHLPLAHASAHIKKNKLTPFLGKYNGPPGDICAVYPSSRNISKLLRSFLDHIIEQTTPIAPWNTK